MNDDNDTIRPGRKFHGGKDPDIGCKKAAEIAAKIERGEDVSGSDIASTFEHVLACPECNPNIEQS